MRTVLHCLPPKDWHEPGFMALCMVYTTTPAVVVAAPGIATLRGLSPVTGWFAG